LIEPKPLIRTPPRKAHSQVNPISGENECNEASHPLGEKERMVTHSSTSNRKYFNGKNKSLDRMEGVFCLMNLRYKNPVRLATNVTVCRKKTESG
jgi:hypothetical protein